MGNSETAPHYGGQIGFLALLSVLSVTGCVTFTDQAGGTSFLPGWSQQSSQAVPVLQVDAIRMEEPAATFIVKFNNAPELTSVYRNFRRDETGTRATYRQWASAHEQLQGLYLVRASYSGELILALPFDDPAGRSAYDVIAALETIENLAYAEIDAMASTSKRR